jgi:membrane fusion protein, multidrug efflux system
MTGRGAHRMRHQDRRVQIGAVLALAIGVGACKPPGGGAEATDAGPMVVGRENVAKVVRDTISSGPRLAGSLEPKLQAQVRAEAGGDVTQVLVDLGQPVKKGELLAQIDATAARDQALSAQSSLAAAQNDLEVAKRQLDRTTRLVEAGALAERDMEVARSNVASAEARLGSARAAVATTGKQFSSATVRSPMDGVVSQRAVNRGDVVAPGAPLFTIIEPSSMRLEGSVPSSEIGAMKIGLPVRFTVRGYGTQTFEGTVERIAPAADPATRQIPILVSIPNVEGKLIAGLFAEGRVSTQTRQALVVPDSAVEIGASAANVMRLKDGKVEQVPVQVGVRDEATERVEIVSGVSEGDVLLTGPARTITPGTPVALAENLPADGGSPPKKN